MTVVSVNEAVEFFRHLASAATALVFHSKRIRISDVDNFYLGRIHTIS